MTGVRVLSDHGRRILKLAGANVDETSRLVRFPRALIEEAIRLATKKFKLGSRRSGRDLEMNSGNCSLLADGGAISVLDWKTGDLRSGTMEDWLTATHLIDAIAEIGVYWNMIQGDFYGNSPGDYVFYWRNLLKNCSKHIQDSTDTTKKSKILLEILQIAFGNRENIRQKHPYSHLLCPMSPLVIDEHYTDAYLETIGYDIPVAIMPMPLMGTTGPASLISTLMIANSEILAMLCLVQAAEPGVPVLYAPIPHTIEPRTWRYTGGAIENAIFGAAVTELGRYYGFPVEGSAGGTDQSYPGTQAGYERALNWTLPTLAWPDILVGPGLLGGSTILCIEQMIVDVEIFRRCIRLHDGIDAGSENWLEKSIEDTGPGGNFLNHISTSKALRGGGWYLSNIGFHKTHEEWKAAGMPDLIDEIQENVRIILDGYQPLPLDVQVIRELEYLERKVREED
jgi:trimethylamine--corrinoid protein Co-methyltransferase